MPDLHSCCNLSLLYLCGFALGKLGRIALVGVNGHVTLLRLFSFLTSLILSLLMFPSLGMHVGLYAGLQTELWQLCWWMLTRQKLVQLQVIILRVIHLDTEYPACSFYASTKGIDLCINLTLLPAEHYHPFLPIIFCVFFTICRTAALLDLHLKAASSIIPSSHTRVTCHVGRVVIQQGKSRDQHTPLHSLVL